MEEYFEIKLDHSGDNIRISQSLLIEQIIDDVTGMRKRNYVTYLALSTSILTKDKNREKKIENKKLKS